MSGNLKSNNIEKDDFNVKTEDSNYEDSNYQDLIVKLKEIKSTIASIEKTIFK